MSRFFEEEPLHDQFGTYFKVISTKLKNVPELQPGLELAAANPELAENIYAGYTSLIASMPSLGETEREAIRTAKERLTETHGNFGTASEVSADELLSELGDDKRILATLAASSTDTNSAYAAPAVEELVRRMEGGHQLKLAGKQPTDADAESRSVIWGHTMISDPTALVHFVSCHYLERYFAEALGDRGSKLAAQKDFLLNALIDAVLIDHQVLKEFDSIYTMWRTPKQEGGLGWITNDRVASYR